MKSNSELRREALNSLSGRWGGAIALFVIYICLSSAISVTPIAFASFLITLPLSYGAYKWYLTYYRMRGAGDPSLSKLFDGFNDGYTRVFGTMFLVGLYTFLWMLLFIIPGVIKSLSYAMTPFILVDEPGLSYNDAIDRSRAMMRGHKGRLFLMMLNFLMWYTLSLFTCGIALLWIVPYSYNALVAFYEDLRSSEEPIYTC